MRLLGISEGGPAIRVILATEEADLAKQVSSWTVGYAVPNSSTAVLFPARAPGYPHTTIEDALRHELAHVLIWRAAGGAAVPRWFNEGLAMAAERSWGLRDQTRVLVQLASGSQISLSSIDNLFSGSRSDQDRAYALSGAFVHGLMEQYHRQAPAQLLMQIRNGAPFDKAFVQVTGLSLAQAEARFWNDQPLWTIWVPLLSSSTMLWTVVTLIAILAILRLRQRNAAIRKRLDDDEPSVDDHFSSPN